MKTLNLKSLDMLKLHTLTYSERKQKQSHPLQCHYPMQIIHEGLNEHFPGWWIGKEDLKPWSAQSLDVTVRKNQLH